MKIKYTTTCLLALFCAFLMQAQPTIYLIGDSTMSNKKDPEINPERGWGHVLPFFLNNLQVENHAVNGRSTKSFIDEGRWEVVKKSLRPQDYVFIQFGHNDAKAYDPSRYTNPLTTYKSNLATFVRESRDLGAFPILFTSVARRNFNEEGSFVDTHGLYPLAVHLLAQELKVPLIDLHLLSEQLELAYGLEGSKKLHLHFSKGSHPYYKEDKADNTHYSVLGAGEIAKIVVQELRQKNILLPYLKENFDEYFENLELH